MEWCDDGVVLKMTPYGDSGTILYVLTRDHGLNNGMIQLTKRKQSLQVGDRIHVCWRARLAENLGYFSKFEVASSAFYVYFQDRSKLLCLSSIAYTLCKALPVNDSHPKIYDCFVDFANMAEKNGDWFPQYLKLELEVLSQLGFALDLSRCAVLNSTDNLAFISPKTGRAISEKAGSMYRHLLFPLPKILRDLLHSHPTKLSCTLKEFILSLRILSFFLYKYLLFEDSFFLKQRKMLVSLLLEQRVP